MPRHSRFALLMAGFLILAPLLSAAKPKAAPLHVGDIFPRVLGQTLTSKSLQLPPADSGKPAVVLFSFSRTAGKDARSWNEHLSGDFSNAVLDYEVIELESVPKLFRGTVMSSIRSSMPLSMQDRTIVLYEDAKLWKQRLAASDDSRAYVFLLGADGHIRWSNSASFTDSEYARLKNELTRLLQPHAGA